MLEALFAGLFGLLIGSFLNVCIYRMPRDLSVVRPRSFCPNCEKQIAWFDNIPVVTYLLVRGRCRHCGESISWRYPAVELLTAVLFFFGVYALGMTAAGFKFCLYSAINIALIFTDLEERILPDEFTLGGMLAGIALAPFVKLEFGILAFFLPREWPVWLVSVCEAVFGAAALSGALWGIGTLYRNLRNREGLGFGDVKMVAMIGAFQGLQGALMTMIAGSLLGSITGLVYIFFARKDASTYELPFGSFLGVAAIVIAVYLGPLPALMGSSR